MLNYSSSFQIIITNILFIIIWNMIIFIFSINIDKKVLDPNRYLFKEKAWEKGGKFYTRTLYIKKWKDSLPQHIGKNGFSKRKLINISHLSKDYIQQFIFETCRAEWNHLMCCLYILISFLINSLNYAILFSFVSILTNVPFIFIQRYNRIRLNKLLLRKSQIKVKI